MELPSFYRTFAKNILRQNTAFRPGGQKLRKSSKICSAAVFLAICAVSSLVQASALYTHLQLKQDLAKFLAEHYQQAPHNRIDISTGNLDNRLRLAQCPAPVEFTPQDQTGLGGNISVKAECNAGHIKWAVHVPAQVMIHREIPVALNDIARGERLTAANMTTALVNVSIIRQDFAADMAAALGREAKRNIGKGEAFRTAVLDAPTTVRRGEVVTLESVAGAIKVSSSGTAMADGRLGQKIRVRNESSQRIITGLVMGQGLVQAL